MNTNPTMKSKAPTPAETIAVYIELPHCVWNVGWTYKN